MLIGFTFVFAFVVQSLFFHTSANMHGDVAYHRGVGLEMLGGDLQGEGPFRHLMAYFGGLYPLGLAYGSHWLGVSFDRFLSVLSWFATLALPAVLIWLGRRIWPRRWLEPALLGFLGTVGSSMATDKELTWVKSVLPSGANLWPLYPRDVALVLVIAAFAVTIGGRVDSSALAVVGVILALTFSVHAQLGFYGLAIVGSYGLWRAWRDSLRSWVGEIALTGRAGIRTLGVVVVAEARHRPRHPDPAAAELAGPSRARRSRPRASSSRSASSACSRCPASCSRSAVRTRCSATPRPGSRSPCRSPSGPAPSVTPASSPIVGSGCSPRSRC